MLAKKQRKKTTHMVTFSTCFVVASYDNTLGLLFPDTYTGTIYPTTRGYTNHEILMDNLTHIHLIAFTSNTVKPIV